MALIRQLDDWLARRRVGSTQAEPINGGLLAAALINWGVVLLGLVVAQGIAALNAIIAARRVLPVDYGQYLACAGLSSLLIVLPNYGLETWLLAQGDATPARVAQWWRSALRSRAVMLGVWLAAMTGLSVFLPAGTYPLSVLFPLALALACDSLVLLTYSALRLMGRHLHVTLLQSAVSLVSLGVTLALPLGPGRIFLFAVGRAVVSAGAALIVIVIVQRALKRPAAYLPTRDLLTKARTFMLADLAVLVYSRSDLALVAFFMGAAGAGAFGTATSLITLSFLVPNALYYLAVPRLSRAYAAAQRSFFLKAGVAQLAMQAAMGLAISAAIVGLAPAIIRAVFGSAYDAAIPVLRLLGPIPFLKSLNFGLGAWLTSSQHQPQRTRVQILCAVFNVTANLAIVGLSGMTGVARVDVISEGVLCLGYALATYAVWRAWRLEV